MGGDVTFHKEPEMSTTYETPAVTAEAKLTDVTGASKVSGS